MGSSAANGTQWVGLMPMWITRSTASVTGGAERAQQEVGFPLLLEFPRLDADYRSSELFPLFQNRVMNRKRPDFVDYVHGLDLPDEADPIRSLPQTVATGRRIRTKSFPRSRRVSADTSAAGSFFMDRDT